MQSNIAAALDQIHALMAEQASNHQSELIAQHAKLEAALDNMNQGLCLFDGNDRLVIANSRFAELFGAPEPGASAAAVLNSSGLFGLMKLSQTGTTAVFSCSLPDGRNIAVTQRPVRAGGWVATYEDTTERRAAEARLTHLARHDQLTGLANRVVFHEHMRQVLGQARADSAVAVLCLDLDRFKAVNDALGHAAGDTVLRTVAQRLRECTRDTDLVVRLGGDEFVIVQGAANQPVAATALAHRLISALSQPIDIDQQQVIIGTSVGIALSEAAGDTAEMLLRSADIALYRAKSDGRGTFRFFEAGMDVLVQTRRKLELDLRGALAREQFELFYQPLVNAPLGGIEGFEALIRWRHPERGLVSPALFIPVAEEIGLIGALGEWVISKACFEAVKWPGSVKVAVNLSPAQFRHRSLAEHVQAALELSGLPAGRLELEITESVLLQDDTDVMKTLFALRALGVRISMDDFGTGYSSLSYLRRFPFDKIKIDQSFVQGMTNHDDCRAIVRAVIGLGQSLNIAVNAEGVETAEQWDALRAEGCNQVQGFLFSKPCPGDDVPGMLAEHGNATMPPSERPAQNRLTGATAGRT
jgi:diguanylate cyclase (GGDEF)-like protein